MRRCPGRGPYCPVRDERNSADGGRGASGEDMFRNSRRDTFACGGLALLIHDGFRPFAYEQTRVKRLEGAKGPIVTPAARRKSLALAACGGARERSRRWRINFTTLRSSSSPPGSTIAAFLAGRRRAALSHKIWLIVKCQRRTAAFTRLSRLAAPQLKTRRCGNASDPRRDAAGRRKRGWPSP